MNYQIESMRTLVNLENQSISNLLKQLYEFEENYDGHKATADQRAFANMFRSVADKLEDAKNIIEYYQKPVILEGTLYKQPNGRYAVGDKNFNVEFTCGAVIEILEKVFLDGEIYEWIRTKIDTKDGRYYAVSLPNTDLEGMRVRTR